MRLKLNEAAMERKSVSLAVGDRELPLEADLDVDPVFKDSEVGSKIRVSPVAGGDLQEKRGKLGEVASVLKRFGQTVGYGIKIDGVAHTCSAKDVYIGREVLEDVQAPTATSVALSEGLAHWVSQPRTYWIDLTDGIESLCFQLASITPSASIKFGRDGWKFLVPEAMPNRHSVVDCRVVQHGSFWTLAVMVYPVDGESVEAGQIANHWARTFSWSHRIAVKMCEFGFPWQEAARLLMIRAKASAKILEPLFRETLETVVKRKHQDSGNAPYYRPEDVVAGFSNIRLKPGYVGLTEPPTDRRPYTVVSISPRAVSGEDKEYLKQVVLHECLHIAVASNGGDPHNEEFAELAEALGLDPKYRD